ncbi:MAG: hypothetical protein Q7T33_09240 [Dehalococcoidia bacterium]|nr:hypothetical protein [Dehalococcoidia bacterium]
MDGAGRAGDTPAARSPLEGDRNAGAGSAINRCAPNKGRYARAYLGAVASTPAGGTSEVNRNIIATRGLGLPRGE